MDINLLNEAFRQFELLEEEDFRLTDDDDMSDMNDYILSGTDDEVDVIDVMDMDANDETEIKDSYVGNIILKCPVCQQLHYEELENVELNDDRTLANVGDECPNCGETGGFEVSGEVIPAVSLFPELNDELKKYFDTDEDEESTEDEDEDEEEASDETDEEAEDEDVDDDTEDEEEIEDESIKTKEHDVESDDDELDECDKAIHESVDDFTMTMDDGSSMSMETKEDGGVIITTTPAEDSTDFTDNVGDDLALDDEFVNGNDTGAEQIGPLSDSSIAEIEGEEPIESEEEIEPIEEPEAEEPEETNDDEGAEDVDIDFDDFDEDTFNEVGESYLRKTYENVKSFNVSDVSQDKNTLIVEGVIKFNSGVTKPTKFKFEATTCNKSNRVRFIGENMEITRGKKAFALTGKVSNNKLMTESLRYNYCTMDTEGVSRRISGTEKIKK